MVCIPLFSIPVSFHDHLRKLDKAFVLENRKRPSRFVLQYLSMTTTKSAPAMLSAAVVTKASDNDRTLVLHDLVFNLICCSDSTLLFIRLNDRNVALVGCPRTTMVDFLV